MKELFTLTAQGLAALVVLGLLVSVFWDIRTSIKKNGSRQWTRRTMLSILLWPARLLVLILYWSAAAIYLLTPISIPFLLIFFGFGVDISQAYASEGPIGQHAITFIFTVISALISSPIYISKTYRRILDRYMNFRAPSWLDD